MFDPNELNNEQLIAASKTGCDILLAAGPGSGKTHTITARIMYLTCKCGIDPSKILVITYTKDAAMGMQKRFMSKLSYPMPVTFGTFHSVFYNMIREYKKPDLPVILYDRNKTKIATSVVRRFIKSSGETDEWGVVRDFLRAVSVYKNTLDINKASDAFKTLQDEDLTEESDITVLFPDMFKYYENIRRKSSLMDFDDMVYDCRYLLLHDKKFSSRWTGKFNYILIDEFQDINQAQYETVKLLAGNKTEIFAVGDDDQAIYGFRGSEPAILNTYLDERNAALLHLNTNYRSGKSIVDASLSVISENKNRIVKDLTACEDSCSGNVCLQGFDNKASEHRHILNLIRTKDSSMAVLFRTNIEMQYFATFLSAANIPYRIREKQISIFEHFIMKDICAYLMLAYGEADEDTLQEIINKPCRYVDHEYLIGSCGNLDTIINRYKESFDGSGRKQIKYLTDLKKDLAFMKSLSISNSITYLLKKIGYEKFILSQDSVEDKKSDYSGILEKAISILSEAENFDDIELLKSRYEKSLGASKSSSNADAVDLMTAHASKGLEFETVIIPDINEGNFPHGNMPDESSTEEERRIFYVAMTRAERKLFLFYINGKEKSRTVPSRFLAPLLKNNTHKKENGSNQ